MSENVVIELGPLLENRFRKIEERVGLDSHGKGEVLPFSTDNHHAKIVEALKRGTLKEQWEAPVGLPEAATANICTFIFRSEEIRGGRMGDVVNIPIVKDFEVEVLPEVGGSLTEKTELFDVVQTTLQEVGAYTQIPYADVEKLSERILAEIEAKFAKACLRAIDKAILDTLIADDEIPELDKSNQAVYFDADWIPEALHLLSLNGKDAKPEDFILVLNPQMYADLFKDVAGSQGLLFTRPDVVRQGVVAELFGVKILVSSYLPEHTTDSYSAFLIHRNAVAFAPKREMLLETEKDTVGRIVKLTGTYTFGIAILDDQAVCEIKTKAVPSS